MVKSLNQNQIPFSAQMHLICQYSINRAQNYAFIHHYQTFVLKCNKILIQTDTKNQQI